MFTNKFQPLFDVLDASGGVEPPTEPTPNEPPTEPINEPAQPEAKIKINYLGEEKEIDLEEAKTLAQKGMDYDRQKERWDTIKPTIDSMSDIAKTFGFVDKDGHGDTNAYIEAVREAKRLEEIESLSKETALPKELAEELYLSRQERIQREEQAKTREQEDRKTQEGIDFLNFYKEVNGKDWSKEDTLPDEVKELNEQGIPLKFAYSEYIAKQMLKEKEIEKANTENQNSSTGSVTGNGNSTENEFFNSEELDRLTDEQLKNPTILAKAMKSLERLK